MSGGGVGGGVKGGVEGGVRGGVEEGVQIPRLGVSGEVPTLGHASSLKDIEKRRDNIVSFFRLQGEYFK